VGERLTPDTKIGQVLFDWPGDVSAAGASLPLRLHGCFHRLVLSGESPELADVFPPHDKNISDDEMCAALAMALVEHEAAILTQLQFAPQTNEVRRSGVLLPGFCTIAAQTNGLPFVLSELGASAGLNLNWNHYAYQIDGQAWGDPNSNVRISPDWDGPKAEMIPIEVIERTCCDLNPIDLTDKSATQTLLSYLWADQSERLARTKAAIEIANAHPYTVDKMGAVNWLTQRLSTPYENCIHVIYHTIAWQYFSDGDKAAGRALIEAAGKRATKSAPLAWLGLETDGKEPGALLTLRIWQGDQNDGQSQLLGRADYHGRWVQWAA
jgi:hypothetical protein